MKLNPIPEHEWRQSSGTPFTGNFYPESPSREEYEKELRETQRKHLGHVRGMRDLHWRPCMHDSCPECHGTGIKINGSACIHCISCPCPKCTPTC